MQYFILDRRSQNQKNINLKGTTYNSEEEVVDEIFFDGVPLKKKVKEPFTVILDDRRTVYDKILLDKIAIDTVETGAVLLVSPKAKEVFHKLNLPIEFIDVKIKGKNLQLNDYKFVNVIGRINCTDHKKSKLKYLDDDIIQLYDSLVLDETKIPKNTNIFLLGEDITMMVVVSERIKNAIEEANLTGFNFIKPEDYKTFR